MRITRKFTLMLLLVISLVTLLRAVLDGRRSIERFQDEVRDAQGQLARVLDLAVAKLWAAEGWEAALTFLREVESQEGGMGIRWVWLDEQPREEYRPAIPAKQIRGRQPDDGLIRFEQAELPGFIVCYQLVQLAGIPQGAIEITQSTAQARDYVWEETIRQIVTGLLIVLIYGVAASALGARMISRPIQLLIDHARGVAAGDFVSISQVFKRKDEIGLLGLEMNTMSKSLHNAEELARVAQDARVKAEKQLTHADRLAAVGKMVSAFIHDLRTTLGVIGGHASVIARIEVADEQVSSSAQKISEQVKRISDRLRDILTFAGPANVGREVVNLADLAQEAADGLKSITRKENVTVTVDESIEGLRAEVNVTQLRQVLINLMLNGIQAMPGGGVLTVRVGEDAWDQAVRVEVVDQGAGMAEQELGRIYEPFFTTRGEGEGAGLGLSVCKLIVEQHGGRILVESREGEGTSASFTLPRAPEDLKS